MGTRGAIARAVPDGFAGVYHHWDSYPSGLGRTLFTLYNGFFERDLERMLAFLVDEHPAWWSTINGHDFRKPPGWSDTDESYRDPATLGPKCYCHGGRSEEGWVVTDANAAGSGVEYVYAFDAESRQMLILSSYCDPNGELAGQKMVGFFGMGDEGAVWLKLAEISLDGEEPDWGALDEWEAAA